MKDRSLYYDLLMALVFATVAGFFTVLALRNWQAGNYALFAIETLAVTFDLIVVNNIAKHVIDVLKLEAKQHHVRHR